MAQFTLWDTLQEVVLDCDAQALLLIKEHTKDLGNPVLSKVCKNYLFLSINLSVFTLQAIQRISAYF